MQEEFPDLHHKMSKKIAQLTKVIFHLNTRNDENEYNQRNIITAYEQEMDNVVETANRVIQRYKDAADKTSVVDDIEREFSEFKGRIEHEKTQSMVEFTNYKKKVDEREKTGLKDAEAKVANYKTEIDTMRTKFLTMQQTIEKLTKNFEESKNSHKKELGDYVKEQNEKFLLSPSS